MDSDRSVNGVPNGSTDGSTNGSSRVVAFDWPVTEMADYEFGFGLVQDVDFDRVLVLIGLPRYPTNHRRLEAILSALAFHHIGRVKSVHVPTDTWSPRSGDGGCVGDDAGNGGGGGGVGSTAAAGDDTEWIRIARGCAFVEVRSPYVVG